MARVDAEIAVLRTEVAALASKVERLERGFVEPRNVGTIPAGFRHTVTLEAVTQSDRPPWPTSSDRLLDWRIIEKTVENVYR